jgi:hypothetical protein
MLVATGDITTWRRGNERCRTETEEDPPQEEAAARGENMLEHGEAIPLAEYSGTLTKLSFGDRRRISRNHTIIFPPPSHISIHNALPPLHLAAMASQENKQSTVEADLKMIVLIDGACAE